MTEEDKEDIFKTWIDRNAAISKMWNNYYLQIYKPWLEATGELLDRAGQLSKNPTIDRYREFYDEWLKVTFAGNKDKFQEFNIKSNKELFEKILASTKKLTELYDSWITELDENSKKTIELLKENKIDIAKSNETYNLWIKTYGKIFAGFDLPLKNLKEIFEIRTGLPDIYTDSFLQISKVWQESYTKFYKPWMESISTLYNKSIDISQGNIGENTYKEFFSIWLDTYKQTYGKIFDLKSAETKESFENFIASSNVYINLYKSWMVAMESLTQKIKELSETKNITEPDMAGEYLKLWIKTYEKFFDSFFENMPTVEPLKDLLEPIKTATKIYLYTFSKMIDISIKFYSIPNTVRKSE